jgi:hypothetical protein
MDEQEQEVAPRAGVPGRIAPNTSIGPREFFLLVYFMYSIYSAQFAPFGVIGITPPLPSNSPLFSSFAPGVAG